MVLFRRLPFRPSAGSIVRWKWGSGSAAGTVAKVFTDRVTRTIKGKEITRDADEGNPACLIEHEDGDRVPKSESELAKA